LTLNSNTEDAKRHSLNTDTTDGQKRNRKQNEVISIDEEVTPGDHDIEAYHLA
jgi:hypothetical protein